MRGVGMNAFHWREYPRDSIFASDPAFQPIAGGKTRSQVRREGLNKHEERTGRSAGYIPGLNRESDERARLRREKR
jgi:hypothetical protein